MPMDDLFKAMEMFKTGAQEYQQTQAVDDAQKQIAQVNTQAKNEEERFAQSQRVGQDLALRLTAAHAAPAAIAESVKGLVPSASEIAQTAGTLKLEKMKTEAQIQAANIAYQRALDVQGLKNDSQVGKGSAKDIAGINKEVTAFGNQPQIKDILKGLPKLQDSLKQIESGKGQYGSTALINLAQLGMIRNQAGRVNVQEILGTNPDQSSYNKLWTEMGLQATGEAPANKQEFFRKVLERSVENSQSALHEAAQGHAESLKTVNPNVDAQQISTAIHQRYGIKQPKSPASSAGPSASADAAQAWLNANPNDPRAPSVRQKLIQMQGKP